MATDRRHHNLAKLHNHQIAAATGELSITARRARPHERVDDGTAKTYPDSLGPRLSRKGSGLVRVRR